MEPSIDTSKIWREDAISQLPALRLLQTLGWEYLSPSEAWDLRGNRQRNVLFEGILIDWLRANNRFRYKGRELPFTENSLHSAVQALKEVRPTGLVRINEDMYELLTLGKSLQQSVDGDLTSSQLQYINWSQPDRNVYHVTEEFAVERSGRTDTRRPDLVLFVNGIPFAVIECKSPSAKVTSGKSKTPVEQAISQQIRNQKDDEIPALFHTVQLMLSLAVDEAKFGTVGTAMKFWSIWRELTDGFDKKVQQDANTPLPADQVERLFAHRKHVTPEDVEQFNQPREITTQDRLICALCTPERILELAKRFTVFDAGQRKVARYQQYFTVQNILDRIHERDSEGKRRGGVVWHTQGSGKSLTMVMLAHNIALDKKIPDYKIILVTDRVDLDDQIYKVFHQCDAEPEKAKSGQDLVRLLKSNRQRIITTVINKFEASIGRHGEPNRDSNIFVLVDEAHRTQYSSRHANMRVVLPNACYIGFTGTPIMKKDRNTVEKFGGIIRPTYTIQQAVEDKAVVPLLYEGRHVDQTVDEDAIDRWFERETMGLTPEQAGDLKRKFASADHLNKTEQKVLANAWDISTHYCDHLQGTGMKAQLVAQDKATALLYHQFLEELGQVSSAVLISGPDEREGETDLESENKEAVQRFWKAMMNRFGNETTYNKQLINGFKHSEEPEILIVVDKLLTGFDAPPNTVLYLTRRLKDHTLLQAIARVNRLYEGKEFGFILDYRGVLGSLDEALTIYAELAEDFDPTDLEHLMTDVNDIASTLPQKHSILWDTFKELKGSRDPEQFQQHLADQDRREKFYERLSAYARTLDIALASQQFLEETSRDQVQRYKADLKFFSKLRIAVRRRYAEAVDFGEYEQKIQKLIDRHVAAGEVIKITPQVNIFDQDAFAHEVDKLEDPAAKADTIAHRTARTINEKMMEDPEFYKRFSEMLKKVIDEFRAERIRANEYLKKVTEIMQKVLNRTGDDIPQRLEHREVAKAYFGTIKVRIDSKGTATVPDDTLAELAIVVDDVIGNHRVVNWTNDVDVQNKMRTAIEDALFDFKSSNGIDLSLDDIDDIMEQCLSIAKVRQP